MGQVLIGVVIGIIVIAVLAVVFKNSSPSGQHDFVRKVVLHYESGRASEYFVLTSQLDRFKRACLRLHYRPGINPHTEKTTARIEAIASFKLDPEGPYWWSTPDLQNNGDSGGAMILYWKKVPDESWVLPVREQKDDLSAA